MKQPNKINLLEGPILVIGASGFVGANLLHALLKHREDVVGTFYSGDSWRLNSVNTTHLIFMDLHNPTSVFSVLERVRPKTIFDCSSFGAYSFEQDIEHIHTTNYLSLIRLMEQLSSLNYTAYIHAGSSSEYGLNAAAPSETDVMLPNSHYAVSKAAASHVISYYGNTEQKPVCNLRLYSVYGPYEDSSRLIPTLCRLSLKNQLPQLANPQTERDFVFVDDIVDAFVAAAIHIDHIKGESINIGSGRATCLADLAQQVKTIFNVSQEPEFNPDAGRSWDVDHWYANATKAQTRLNWYAKTDLATGLTITRDWWKTQLTQTDFVALTKRKLASLEKKSISAIIACYKDAQAIPIMYQRLIAVFEKLHIDYEIIFVNDASPDNSAQIIQELSAKNSKVIGITHSRNFGSQAAFRSGMELASKEAVVLMDGDLQDPPELIEDFVREWRSGAEVVYGRRIKREMPIVVEWFYRAFYRVFASLSEIPIPKNAGDFSLIDHRVVYWLLQCQERDLFLRGLRAYVGFKQTGVDYVRPERMFGTTTNNWIKNIGWAKKGIFSFTRVPLHLLTAFGSLAFIASILLAFFSVYLRFFHPDLAPKGVTFISLLVMFFGSSTILGIGLLGEYIGKIIEETKERPSFIRKELIIRGKIQPENPSTKSSIIQK